MAHRSRVVAVIMLLVVAAAALHGYLPGAETPPRDRPTSGLGSLFAVVAMVVVSMAIIVIAILTQSRNRPVSHGPDEPPRERAGDRQPLTWRMILIAVAVVIAWLLLVTLLSRINAHLGIEQPPPDASTTPSGAPAAPGRSARRTRAVVQRLLSSRRVDGAVHDDGLRRGCDRGP